MKVVQQPKDGVVYQRILKPHPTVSLISWEDDDVTLVVEASAVRSDTEEPLLDSLEGNKIACISKDTFASFSKLKISHTSRKIGTNFKIKFSLMKYANSASIPEPTGAFVLSNAFEVFSHSQYIRLSFSFYYSILFTFYYYYYYYYYYLFYFDEIGSWIVK